MVFKTASGSFAPTSSSALVRQEEGEGAAGRRERGGEGRRQEGQTECFLFLSPPRHIYLITLSSPFTPHIISFPSASICQFKPDGRTCSRPPQSVRAHLHAHLHTPPPPPPPPLPRSVRPDPALLFHLKKSWLSGTPSCPPLYYLLSHPLRLHLADSIIHQLLSGR